MEHLKKDELLKVIQSYDKYIQEASEDNKYTKGWNPVCIEEYYINEYQNELEDNTNDKLEFKYNDIVIRTYEIDTKIESNGDKVFSTDVEIFSHYPANLGQKFGEDNEYVVTGYGLDIEFKAGDKVPEYVEAIVYFNVEGLEHDISYTKDNDYPFSYFNIDAFKTYLTIEDLIETENASLVDVDEDYTR